MSAYLATPKLPICHSSLTFHNTYLVSQFLPIALPAYFFFTRIPSLAFLAWFHSGGHWWAGGGISTLRARWGQEETWAVSRRPGHATGKCGGCEKETDSEEKLDGNQKNRYGVQFCFIRNTIVTYSITSHFTGPHSSCPHMNDRYQRKNEFRKVASDLFLRWY